MLLFLSLVLCILLWVFFSVYEGYKANIDLAIESAPLQELTILYKISKRRVNFLGSLLGRFKVIIICYSKLGNRVLESVSPPIYAVGIIVNEGNIETTFTNYLMSLLGYKEFVIPASTLAVTASHSCKNPVSLHLVLRRMHQELDSHKRRHRLCAYPSIEIYNGSSVRVIAPLTRQTQYYVPEVLAPPKWSWCLNYNVKHGAYSDDEDDNDYYDDDDDEEEEEDYY